jgi:peptidoglycan hydrolase CwlO-like protein
VLHSSEQLKREQEFARQNREYLDGKREQIQDLGGNNERAHTDKRNSRTNKFCCLFVGVVLILSMYAIYYFVMAVKGPLVEDYYKKKQQVQEVLPQGIDEVKKGLDQGQQLLDETQKNAADIQNKIDTTKAAVEDVQQKYDQAKKTYDEIKKAKEDIEGLLKK